MKFTSRRRLWLIVLLLAGTAIRLYRLGAESLWYDETVSVYLAGSPAPELLRHTAADIHPPGYYLLLRGWLAVMGYPTGRADPDGMGLEFAAAFFSLAFGLLLMALVYSLARRLVPFRLVAPVAMALVGLSAYNIWYGQEVRMYTLAACLGVLVFYALWRAMHAQCRHGDTAWWVVYAGAGAAGLYTLYYFAFLLVALNVWAGAQVLRLPRGTGGTGRDKPVRGLGAWLLANAGIVVLYLPWFPTAIHQAFDPPVPPWRTAVGLGTALWETWEALSLGQSAPSWLWPVVLLILGLYAVGLTTLAPKGKASRTPPFLERPANGRGNRECESHPSLPLFLATFGSLALVLLASIVTPLYHPRYIFAYSPAFYVVLAAGLVWLGQRLRPVAIGAGLVWAAASVVTLGTFWSSPLYRSDDHRGAVRYLQARWRPGDVLLANAGYAYTAILTYWDGPLAWRGRLTQELPPAPDLSKTVIWDAPELLLLTTGHLDGDPELGWGDPRSDFFSMPASAAADRVEALFATYSRVWQYRIYDTVNDPQGVVRGLLEKHGRPFDDQMFPGEANLRVQGWIPAGNETNDFLTNARAALVADTLELRSLPLPTTILSGQTLYPVLFWWPGSSPLPGLATSLRLVAHDGSVWAQPPDERPLGPLYPADNWTPGAIVRQSSALPVPAGTPPGTYVVELVAYDPATGKPWPVMPRERGLTVTSQGLSLGQVEVKPPSPAAFLRPALARVGPLSLVVATSPAGILSPGAEIPVELLWQARSQPGAPLVVVVQLLDESGKVAASLEEQPLGGAYPSQEWGAGEVVRDRHTLALPADIAPGTYRLVVGMYDAADQARLAMRTGPLGSSDHFTIKTITVR